MVGMSRLGYIKQQFLESWRGRPLYYTVFTLLTFFILGAFLSYSPYDSSYNRVSDNALGNIWGAWGAYWVDIFVQLFGFASAWIVTALFLWWLHSWLLHELSMRVLRFASCVLALLSLCALLHLLPSSEKWPFYVGYGGLVGDYIYARLYPLVGGYFYIGVLAVIIPAAMIWGVGITFAQLVYFFRTVFYYIGVVYLTLKRLVLSGVNYLLKLLRQKEIDVVEEDEAPVLEKPKKHIVEYSQKKPKKSALQQKTLKFSDDEFDVPEMGLLAEPSAKKNKLAHTESSLEQNAKLLKSVLDDFGVQGEIIKVRPGPVVTLYELEPSPGTKASRVIGLSDDIARSMSSISARISVIPGRNVLGIELPNATRETVYLRELLETEEYKDERVKVPFALGKDIGGEPVMADLSRMPHLLIAGTTGSGKSVAVNAMILSFIYRLSPEECKFIMIDPKMLELSVYDGIPHLLAPVVTEPAKAVVALKWAVREMEDRYRAMSNVGVRNIAGYNKRIEEALKNGEVLERKVQTGFNPETGEPIIETQPLEMKKLPFIVVIVDEMADLMLTAGKDIESSIQRLAQMARAAGIHMVMATQRPSVDVITGVIKANFPTRISFQVTSKIDSRTILGEMGAEQLLGMGDMLYMSGGGRLVRVHGPFVDDKEVEKVVTYLKKQGKPSYIEDVTREDESFDPAQGAEGTGDSLYDKAVAIVLRDRKVSTSYIQRQLKIGYNRAADIIDKMESEGVISAANHVGKREILVGN
jgi:S-DNA-T family DNA segregation ATPase FtsK/SpoIIIE